MATIMFNFKFFLSSLLLVVTLASSCILPPGVSSFTDGIQPGLLVDFTDADNVVVDTVCLPMRSADIRGIVVDGIVEVTITQEFETYICPNCTWPETELTQSRYQLPLDEQAAVSAFRAEIGDRVIEGVVKDNEEAQKDFDDAISAGKPAFLAKQTRPDVFEVSCGNMPANSIVRVTLVYVAPLEVIDASTYRFVLPTKIAPRYDPRTGNEPIPDLEPLLNSGVRISLGTLMSNSAEASSNTHTLQTIAITKTVTAIEVVDADPLVRDVVIDFMADELPTDPQIFVEQSKNGTYAMMLSWVTLLTENDIANGANKEFVFIVDRSGSMFDKIGQLRTAMRVIFENLNSDAMFNIIGFGSSFEYLFPEGSQMVSNEEAYTAALFYIDSIESDFGGTEILSPIKDVLLSSPISTHQRNLFLITDGQVSNEDQVIEFVGDNLGSSRVFTLGIGENVGRNLLNGVARNGDGTSDFVNGNSDTALVEAVLRQIDAASSTSSAAITQMEFADVSPTAIPFRQSPIIAGRRVVKYFLTDGIAPPGQFNLTTLEQRIEGPVSKTFSISPAAFIQTSVVFETDVIHKIAAREQIRDLEEGRSPLHIEGAEPSESEVRDAIVRIGVKYQILSSETSFVAIDNLGWTGVTEKAEITGGGGASSGGGSGGSGVGGLCFSGQNLVLVRNKGYTYMKDVGIGDMVSIGSNRFSPVYSFGHRNVDNLVQYLVLHTESSETIEISRDHLIFVVDLGAIPASFVAVGTPLVLADGGVALVTKISVINRFGAFAPFTQSGTIAVGGLIASNYVSLQTQSASFLVGGVEVVSMHKIAHVFQAPRRMMCSLRLAVCSGETYREDGISTWVYGPFLAAQWIVSQSGLVLTILSIAVLFTGMVLYVLELIFTHFHLVAVLVGGYWLVSMRTKKMKLD